MDTKCSLSGLPNKGISLRNMQILSSAMSTSRLSYARKQLQQQVHQPLQKQQQQHHQVLVASGCDQSVGTYCGIELDRDVYSESLLHSRQSDVLQSGTMHVEDVGVSERSGEHLLFGVTQTRSFNVDSLGGLSPVMLYPHSNNPEQSQMMGAAYFPIHTSQLPHLPVLEKQSVSQPSATSLLSQQGAFSDMLQDAWTNLSQQRLAGNLPANVRPSLFQHVNVGAMGMDHSTLQRLDDHGRQDTSMYPRCSIISEKAAYEKKDASEFRTLLKTPPQEVDMASGTYSTPIVQESISGCLSDGNPSASIVPMVQLHQHEIDGLNLGQRSSVAKQTRHSSLLSIASCSHNLAALGHNFKSPAGQNQNDALQQLHTMKPLDVDSNKLYDMRFKGDYVAYPRPDSEEMPQSSNRMSNNPLDSRSCPINDHQSPFASDAKMLCFSLEANGNQNMARDSQVIGSDFCSQDLTHLGLNSPNRYSSIGKISMSPSVGVVQPKQMDHNRVAPSWFEQYENYKIGQTLAKASVQHCFFSRASESTRCPSSVTHGNDSSHTISFWHGSSTATANVLYSSVHYKPANDIDRSVIPRSNKRKTAPSRLTPWHKEITRGSDKFWNISMAELEWAQATKRSCLKVENEDKTRVDGYLSIPQAQRRLVLTTQLMQQLVPALPLRILAPDVTLEYESVTYHVARLALGDACGGISSSRSSFHFSYVGRNVASSISEKTTKDAGEHFFSQVTEGYIGRMNNLENDLSRSEKRDSLLDIRVECLDLERFFLVNRFGKFHSRSQAVVADNSSFSEAAPWKMFLRRYVTAFSMPGNLPEVMICLSL